MITPADSKRLVETPPATRASFRFTVLATAFQEEGFLMQFELRKIFPSPPARPAMDRGIAPAPIQGGAGNGSWGEARTSLSIRLNPSPRRVRYDRSGPWLIANSGQLIYPHFMGGGS